MGAVSAGVVVRASGPGVSRFVRSRPSAFQCSIAAFGVERVDRGRPSRRSVRNPSSAISSAGLLGDHEQVVDDVLRLAAEHLPQVRVLRRDADRARVEVALPHHDAAERDQRRRAEAELFGAEQRGDHDVAAGLQTAIGLQHDTAPQVVRHERLVRLGDAEFPRQAGVLDARQRRGAGSAAVAGDQHVVGVPLHDARRQSCRRPPRRPASRSPARRGWRSSGRRSAARGPRSSRCRGVAAG